MEKAGQPGDGAEGRGATTAVLPELAAQWCHSTSHSAQRLGLIKCTAKFDELYKHCGILRVQIHGRQHSQWEIGINIFCKEK